MKRLRELFRTPKKAAIAAVCAVEMLAVTGGMAACAAKDEKGAAQITLERAEEAALSDAGLTASEVTSIKTKSDVENGISVYDVEFYAGNTKYEYEINADTGSVYSRSKETTAGQESLPSETEQGAGVPVETQQDINSPAFSGSEQPDADLSGTPQKDSASSDTAKPNTNPSGTSQPVTQQPTQTGNGQIGLDAAKSAALSDAGLTSADVTYTKEKLDYEDGIAVYDIEFYTATHEYEYEINAVTGAVYSRDVEAYHHADTGHHGSGTGEGNYIGEEKARSAALSHAGFSASDVSFSKSELDNDDGQMVYEIEFYKDGREYEYKINAISGAVIEFDVD